MEIKRNAYLRRLIGMMNETSVVKIVTGARRVGKSYLLNPIFTDYLKSQGIKDDHIIIVDLDVAHNLIYHDPVKLEEYLDSCFKDNDIYYVILDEIQNVTNFSYVLNYLLKLRHIDVYATGSNSRYLSSDIATEFRGRSVNIYVNSLSFNEYYNFVRDTKDKYEAYREYSLYGGLPQVALASSKETKEEILESVYRTTYYQDIVNRYHVLRTDILDEVVDVLTTSVGSFTNPNKIYNTYKSRLETSVSINTITSFLNYLTDSFIVRRCNRFNVTTRKEINGLRKYYFSDIGIRNYIVSFSPQRMDRGAVMENIVYNELLSRGLNPRVCITPKKSGDTLTLLECDFYIEKRGQIYCLQVASDTSSLETRERELLPFKSLDGNVTKIMITGDDASPYYIDNIYVMDIRDFLLDETILS